MDDLDLYIRFEIDPSLIQLPVGNPFDDELTLWLEILADGRYWAVEPLPVVGPAQAQPIDRPMVRSGRQAKMVEGVMATAMSPTGARRSRAVDGVLAMSPGMRQAPQDRATATEGNQAQPKDKPTERKPEREIPVDGEITGPDPYAPTETP